MTTPVVRGLTTIVVSAKVGGMSSSKRRPSAAAPEGTLTRTQYEILDAIWRIGGEGATVAEIWGVVSEQRDVARTTILNLVDRLEKRGWVAPLAEAGVRRYRAATTREATQQHLVEEVVFDFFDGSAVDLVSRLLGAGQLRAADRRRLRELIDDGKGRKAKQARKQS